MKRHFLYGSNNFNKSAESEIEKIIDKRVEPYFCSRHAEEQLFAVPHLGGTPCHWSASINMVSHWSEF